MRKISLILFVAANILVRLQAQEIKYNNVFYFDHDIKVPSYFEYNYYHHPNGNTYITDDNYIYIKDGVEKFGLNHVRGIQNIIVSINEVPRDIQGLIKEKYENNSNYVQDVMKFEEMFYNDKILYYDKMLNIFNEDERKEYEDSVIYNLYVCEPVSIDSVRIKLVSLYDTEYNLLKFRRS